MGFLIAHGIRLETEHYCTRGDSKRRMLISTTTEKETSSFYSSSNANKKLVYNLAEYKYIFYEILSIICQ